MPQKSSKHFLISISFPDVGGGGGLPVLGTSCLAQRLRPPLWQYTPPPPLPPNPGSATGLFSQQQLTSSNMIIGGVVKLVLLIHCRSRTGGGGGQGGNVGGVRVEGKGGVGWSRGGGDWCRSNSGGVCQWICRKYGPVGPGGGGGGLHMVSLGGSAVLPPVWTPTPTWLGCFSPYCQSVGSFVLTFGDFQLYLIPFHVQIAVRSDCKIILPRNPSTYFWVSAPPPPPPGSGIYSVI